MSDTWRRMPIWRKIVHLLSVLPPLVEISVGDWNSSHFPSVLTVCAMLTVAVNLVIGAIDWLREGHVNKAKKRAYAEEIRLLRNRAGLPAELTFDPCDRPLEGERGTSRGGRR